MNPYIVVALGGSIGACLRFAINEWLGSPQATFAVNAVGSLMLGVILAYFSNGYGSKELTLFLGTGILGAFTTMSAFSVETIEIFSKDQIAGATYFGATVFLCPLLAFLGWKVVEFTA